MKRGVNDGRRAPQPCPFLLVYFSALSLFYFFKPRRCHRVTSSPAERVVSLPARPAVFGANPASHTKQKKGREEWEGTVGGSGGQPSVLQVAQTAIKIPRLARGNSFLGLRASPSRVQSISHGLLRDVTFCYLCSEV